MATNLKIASAFILAVILLLSPIGKCSGKMQAQVNSDHPCCPKTPASTPSHSSTDGCEKSDCVCADGKPVSYTAAAAPDDAPVLMGVANLPVALSTSPHERVFLEPQSPPSNQRFVSIHQFRI